MRPGRRAPEPVASRAGCRCERLILRDTSANSPQHDFTNTARGTDDNTNTAAMEAIDTSSMTAATPVAGTERLRAKQPLDVRTATKGLFALSGTGNDAALKALFDDCVLIDHTAQGLDDCQPVPADLIRDEDGATALLPACEGGHVECVKLLLKHGCPPGKPNRHGRTPVMTACFGGQADCLALLLEARASPYEGLMLDSGSGVEGGATPIVMAIDHLGRSADDACVRQLLRADERLRAPLSTSGGAEAAAARAIRAEADAYYATALTRACASGLSAGVRLLLQARADRYGSIYYGSAYLLWLYLY